MKALLALILLALAGLGALLLVRRQDSSPAMLPAATRPVAGAERPGILPELAERAAETTREEVAPGEAARSSEPSSSPACTLEGSIRTTLGDPVPSALVRLKDELGGERKTEADAAGRFSLAGLQPGRWWAHAGARDHEPALAVLDLEPARPIVQQDFLLRPDARPRIKIRVQDPAGAPWWSTNLDGSKSSLWFIELAAAVTREPPDLGSPSRAAPDPTSSLARFQDLRGKDEPDVLGLLVLHEPPPLFVSVVLGDAVIDWLPLEPGEDELVFVIPPERLLDHLCSVRWRLVDARSGEGLRTGACSVVHGRVTVPRVLPDENGWFLLERLAPREIVIRSRLKGYATLEREVRLEPGLTDLGSIPLEPEVWIRGRVLDPDGTPVSVLLEVRRADHPDRRVRGAPLIQASGGQLLIDGLERAEYVLRTSDTKPWSSDGSKLPEARGMSRSVVVSTLDGPVDDFVLQLETPSVLVLLMEDAGSSAWRFRIVEPSGLALRSGSFDRVGPTSVRLPPGQYVLEILDQRQRKLRERSLVLTAEPLRLSISP